MPDEIMWDTDVPTAKETGPFNELIGIEVIALAPGRSRVRIGIDERHLNILDIAHGGAVASALDYAMGLAAGYVAPGVPRRKNVTLSLNIQFLMAVPPGKMSITAKVVGGGRRTSFVEAEMCDDAGDVYARSQAVFSPADRR
ncbi:MAG: PaaI family thioesterase [Arenibacterium sp.]